MKENLLSNHKNENNCYLGHPVQGLEGAADKDQVPGEDVALGMDQSAGGVVLHGVEQLLGRVQTGRKQLEDGEKNSDEVRPVLGDSLETRPS